MNTTSHAPNETAAQKPTGPDWVVKAPRGIGRRQRLERIGAAWNRDDGGICLRLSGTQIVADDIYLYPVGPEVAE